MFEEKWQLQKLYIRIKGHELNKFQVHMCQN